MSNLLNVIDSTIDFINNYQSNTKSATLIQLSNKTRMSEEARIKVNHSSKQYNISPVIIVNAYIHQIEKLLNPQISQIIPIDIYQLCADFYILTKLLFIKYKSNIYKSKPGEIKIGVIDTKKQRMVNQIIFNLPEGHHIENKSLCFIPNISNHLSNLHPDIIKSMNMDFKNIPYDGFFCFLHRIKYYYIPCLIFYNAANSSYDIEAKILISSQKITDCDNKIDVNTAFKIDMSPRIIVRAWDDDNQFYQLKLDKFEFEPIFDKPPFTGHIFVEQHEVEYEEVLHALLNGNCCVGVYDENAKRWRSGVYMNHWPKTRRIMIQFVNNNIDLISVGDIKVRYKTIQHFPAKNVWIDEDKFMVTAQNLKLASNLSKDSINKWIQHNEKNKSQLKKYWIQPPASNIDEMDEFEWIKYYFLLRFEHRLCSDDQNLICISTNTEDIHISRTRDIDMPLIYDHKLNTAFLSDFCEDSIIESSYGQNVTTKELWLYGDQNMIIWFHLDLLFCAHLSQYYGNCVCFYSLDTTKGEYKWTYLYKIDLGGIGSIETLFD